ncbi:hypothetical protein CL653_03580 [bacterium]|nr:hypothetical protein [bacterium]|tara:strand:- start:593 stop:829 length:237 start_codon:yes stop_codon:yes gene_type:complete
MIRVKQIHWQFGDNGGNHFVCNHLLGRLEITKVAESEVCAYHNGTEIGGEFASSKEAMDFVQTYLDRLVSGILEVVEL